MKKTADQIIYFLFILLTAAILLPSLILAESGQKSGVTIMEKETFGEYLADSNGVTLYSFSKDLQNTSQCIEGCSRNWPPFFTGPDTLSHEKLKPEDFGVITRADGRKQMTYRGMPLYYFIKDRYPGDIFGHGIGNAWFLVSP